MLPPVLILAGGLGTRIQSLTHGGPKYLVSVNNEPFGVHQLRLLKKRGFEDIVLCLGSQAEPIIELLGDGLQFELNISYELDGDELLGTGGAIKKASRFIHSPFCVLYGDSYLDFNVKPLYEQFLKSNKQAVMTVFRNQNQWGKSNILLKNNEIVRYDKKSKNRQQEMHHIDFGFLIFSPAVFLAQQGVSFDLVDVLQTLIQQNQLGAYEVNHRFYEVGTPEGVYALEDYLRAT